MSSPKVDDVTAVPPPPVRNPEIKTSWLHPTSLIFELLSHSRELIIPIGIAVFSAAQGSRTGLFFGIAFFVPAVIYSVFRYFTLRYKIDRGEMVVKQGLIFRNVRTVPVHRIQNIDLVQNPLHRIFGVAEVRIETASGTEPEATLRVLSMHKIAELRKQVFEQAGPAFPSETVDPASETDAIPVKPSDAGTTLLEIPANWLLKAGLASNRGLLIIGILSGAWFQFDLDDRIDFDQIQNWLPALDGSLFSTLMVIGLVLVALVILRILGIIWFFLRFHNYQMTLHGEDLRITCGLFTKVSATIPRKRIQFISIHRPIFMRWLGLASIRIETAGGGSMSEDATTTVSRRWFVPVISEDRVGELVNCLRPELLWNESTLDWKPLASRTKTRLIRLAIIQSLVFAGAGFLLSRQLLVGIHPWGFLLGPAMLPLLLLWARKKARAMRYTRTDELVSYRSGVFNRKTSLTFYDKVQTVSVEQTPFDRRWKMATLVVDTAASGTAEHRIRVRYLDDVFACQEHRTINDVASRFQPDFG